MSNKTVLSLFRDQATLRPSFPAVVSSAKVVSYAELDKRSDVVSAALRRHGVGRDDLVPILAERSVDLLVALLGVLKTGASYVPVDRTHPDKRKENIARQCAAKLLLATRDDRPELAGRPVVRVEDLIARPPDSAPPEDYSAPSATDVAYVIFTSGTTGAPKGVVVEHHSLASLMLWHNARFGVEASSRTTLMAGVGFDVSQWEIWSTLVAGGSIHLLDESARLDPERLLFFYAEHAISHAFVPTVFVPDLVRIPQPETLSLRYLFTAGEKLRPVETEHLPYTLVDYYGPTESTIFATVNFVGDARPDCADTIGHPVAGCQVCIVDDALKPVADGEVGELLIAGSCLARGYLGDPELTAERFVAVPAFAARAYRTGDLARRLPDGSIQFLGRRDNQVKIRGNRVELGEIETTLLRDPSVQDALVLLEDGLGRAEKRVVAFVVPRHADRTDDVVPRLRESLKQELPDYMWPTAYVCLDAMPRTLNDKIDREVLRARFDEARGRDRQGAREAWGDELERRIADVWHEMLGHGKFGADDSFFDVGGHSLLASALVRELSARLSVKTYIRDIYEHSSVRRLAEAVRARPETGTELDGEPVRELQHDIVLPAGLDLSGTWESARLVEPQHILLTGATGFVGIHLLAELLQTTHANVHCPVRGSDDLSVRERLGRVVADYQLNISQSDWQRVHVYSGDLSQPSFGMRKEIYGELAEKADIVYHSASAVNFIQPYSYMKKDNVEGLRQVVAFAGESRIKPLILLSTISVYSWGHLHTGKITMFESDDIDQNLPAVITDLGYVRSKWVMEKIADLAAETGLPLMTFRLGYATFHSRTGAFAKYQWWSRLIQTCLTHHAVPDLRNLREGLTTVDYMVESISAISRQPSALGKKFNLIPSPRANLTLKEFFALLEDTCGVAYEVLPFREWVALWEHDREAPLYPLLSMFKDNMYAGMSTVELYQDTYLWDCSNVTRHLAETGIREPVFDAENLTRYLDRVRAGIPGAGSQPARRTIGTSGAAPGRIDQGAASGSGVVERYQP